MAAADRTPLAAFKIPVSGTPALPVVPVEIDGRPYPFVIDTGSSLTLYDASLQHLLGKPIRSQAVRTGSGRIAIDIHRAPKARLGKLPLDTEGRVGCMDLRDVREAVYQASGRDIVGIVGMDFLKHHILRVGCLSGEVEILKAGTSPAAHWGAELALEFVGKGIPAVSATLPGGLPASFLVDTGDAGIGDLEEDLFDRMAAEGMLALGGEILCATGSGYRSAREGVLERFGLGPFEDTGLSFFRSHWNGLGIGYLSRYTVTFDFPRSRMYLAPLDRPHE